MSNDRRKKELRKKRAEKRTQEMAALCARVAQMQPSRQNIGGHKPGRAAIYVRVGSLEQVTEPVPAKPKEWSLGDLFVIGATQPFYALSRLIGSIFGDTKNGRQPSGE
jgi:hypothetical protein